MVHRAPMPAQWWHLLTASPPDTVQCTLCRHHCIISHGRSGYCCVRFNTEGALVSPFLGHFSSIAVDPIEKKPLYHWQPGSQIFSLGSIGCTMRCHFCQNHQIAQPANALSVLEHMRYLSPERLPKTIKELGLSSVAFTYNEPSLQAEYIIAAGPYLREANISVALVTNGQMENDVLKYLMPWVDALNIDLKTFNSQNYQKLGGSLDKVQGTILYMVNAGKHVELTTLVVPGISDAEDECAKLVEWIASISPKIPLHLSRYFPAHQYTKPATDIHALQKLRNIARSRLEHVHIGNVSLHNI